MTPQEAKAGIAAYIKEQRLLLRWLRLRKQITEQTFDCVMYRRSRTFRNRRMPLSPIEGDSFLLGGMSHEGSRDWWLHLLQLMIFTGQVAAKTVNDSVIYSLPKQSTNQILRD